MKKVRIVFILLLVAVFAFSGCASQYSIKFYVGSSVEREYRVDEFGSIKGFDPLLPGFELLSWHEDRESPIVFDDSKPIARNTNAFGKFLNVFTGEETFRPSEMKKVDVMNSQASFGEFGKVIEAFESDEGVYVVAEGYYGYHLDEHPSMTVGVAIDYSGKIKDVSYISAKNQSDGYAERITNDYLDLAYTDKASQTTLEVDPVTGATSTSKAVKYAVWAAASFVSKAFGIDGDTSAEDNAILNALQEGTEFEKLESDYEVPATHGAVLYSALSEVDGKKFMGLIVKGAQTINFAGTTDTGWDSPMPNPSTIALVIDMSTDKIVAIDVISDGSKSEKYFAIPKGKVDAYKNVAITGDNVFDNFEGGLVFDLPYELDISDAGPVITGTTILYTGATENGTFTSQIVRNAFEAAARFYVANK